MASGLWAASVWWLELCSCNPNASPLRQVTLCSNTVKKYETALVVDVKGVGEEVLALLITARYCGFLRCTVC